MQYKIGDHVVIEESNVEGMEKFAGRTGVITRVSRHLIGHPYFIDVDNWGDEGEGVWCSVKCLVEEVKGNEVMKCKFKVGDKVRIVGWGQSAVGKPLYYGTVKTITDVIENSIYPYRIKGTGYVWRDEELVPAYSNEKIVITTDGKTTTATLYHDDMMTVATARCSPEDTFDFNVGAELAMKRLMETVNPVTVDGFKVGDRVTYFGNKGTVICINYYDYLGVQFDTKNTYAMHNCGGFNLKAGKIGELNMCKWIKPKYLKHIDPNKPEPPKYYNGKVVCVEVGLNEGLYTLGKIYEFVDGTFTCDDGRKVHEFISCKRVKSFDEWKLFSSAKWLEIKE